MRSAKGLYNAVQAHLNGRVKLYRAVKKGLYNAVQGSFNKLNQRMQDLITGYMYMVVCLNGCPCAGLVHARWVAHKVTSPCAGDRVAHKIKHLCAVGRVAHKVTHKDAQGAHKVRELVCAQGRMNLVQGPGCAQG